MNRPNREDENRNNGAGNGNAWWYIGAAAAGLAAAGGLLYAAANMSSEEPSKNTETSDSSDEEVNNDRNFNNFVRAESRGVRSVPSNPLINNLDSLLSDIYVRYVAYNESDFRLHYRVFDVIFASLQKEMKAVDPYYKRYSGMKQFAGSHYDRLRIKKPDEFDMDVVIKLPLNIEEDRTRSENSDIIIEPTDAGYLQLKMGMQFINLLYREDWHINQTCYKWKDDNNYLLRTKFLEWFNSVVDKALNKFERDMSGNPVHMVDNAKYVIRKSASGPAVTIIIHNYSTGFRLDVDLVPALRLPESRWPISRDYNDIPLQCKRDFWMVVPKPNKHGAGSSDQSRTWRIALHYQEGELLYDSRNLRTAIKLLKKLRDEENMDKIASYYIKTVVYSEIRRRRDPSFGRESLARLFKILVDSFTEALRQRRIPYFWNAANNLLDGIKPETLEIYVRRLQKLQNVLHSPTDYKQVAKFLLSPYEYEEYKKFL